MVTGIIRKQSPKTGGNPARGSYAIRKRCALIGNEKNDLPAKIEHGDGQTVFREALLAADYNAYRLGQIAFLTRILEK